jgi:ribosome-binding ATPase YchF (GTP1/OBG family)
MEIVALEMVLADLQVVENRLERLRKEVQRKGKVQNPLEPVLLERFRSTLEAGDALRSLQLNPDESKLASGFSFLTLKPLILVLNGGEDGVGPDTIATARGTGSEVVALCAQVEAEIVQLPETDRAEFLADLGLSEPASERLIRAGYRALGLQSFFTVGQDECRAWAVRRGALAPEAARVIHSDLERGFIRAETCSFEELVAAGSLVELKKTGRLRLEGKTYQVQDGDVLNIRFNV